MRRGSGLLLVFVFLIGLAGPGRSAPAAVQKLLAPPVDGVIQRYFEQPASRFGPGHRGIDYGVPSGTRVRAAADGTVTWAGSVAGDPAVTVDHGEGLETTYSILANVEVIRGSRVTQGQFLGSAGADHDDSGGGLHFGVKLDGKYVDPLDYLGPADVSAAIHLAPLIEDESDELPHELTLAHEGAGALARPCRNPMPIGTTPPPPNDNVAVAVAGIGSRTNGGTNAKIFKRGNGPDALGYGTRKTFRFSYAGVDDDDLHEPYEAADTWIDINASAGRLRTLLIKVRRRFPSSDVDLFAHSQGGLVARAMLERLADSYDARLPRVEHLVTYGTPHRGSPLAALPNDLKGTSLSGGWLVGKISDWAEDGGAIPDPRSKAIEQMRPDSAFLQDLAREDVAYGTRVLSLAMPHDAIVPADRALFPGKYGRMLSPQSLIGHDAVLASQQGRAIAYSFLRDAPVSCPGGWDTWGATVGSAIGWAQGMIADAYSSLETAGLLKAFKAAKWAAGKGWDAVKWTSGRAWDAARWTGTTVHSGAKAAGRLVKSAWSALW